MLARHLEEHPRLRLADEDLLGRDAVRVERRCLEVHSRAEPAEPHRRRIHQYGLADKVRLEDRYIPNSEVADYFAAADLVVLPYRRATQSGVAALARAMRRPVLSTRTGAIPESVREGVDGWLVEPGNAAALAERLTRVLADPELLRLPQIEAGPEPTDGWRRLADEVVRLTEAGRTRRHEG